MVLESDLIKLLLILFLSEFVSLQLYPCNVSCPYRRKDRGPINFQAMVPQSVLTPAIVQMVCREYRIMSADIFCRCDATIDQLIDVIEVLIF